VIAGTDHETDLADQVACPVRPFLDRTHRPERLQTALIALRRAGNPRLCRPVGVGVGMRPQLRATAQLPASF